MKLNNYFQSCGYKGNKSAYSPVSRTGWHPTTAICHDVDQCKSSYMVLLVYCKKNKKIIKNPEDKNRAEESYMSVMDLKKRSS